ncbi:MAG: hypothetical protein JW708_04845 [Vallitaleaceae bacterium]|nr:hypothetical protein [Vallitaleaceae bacterium]
MIEKITHNFGWKLLSVGIAFLAWLIILNIEDPTTTRTIDGVRVQKTNVERITSEKKAIEYKAGEVISVRVKGKRSVIDKMNASDIVAYADLEKMSITGAINIQFDLDEGITVVDSEPSMLLVSLENIITVQKEIQFYMEGEPKEGYVYLEPIITPNYLEIEGPESKVGLIKSVLVPVNVDNVTKDVTLYGTPKVIDDSNNVILGLSKSSVQVKIEVPIEKTKEVGLVLNISDQVAEGYELVNVRLSQDKLSVRGKESSINALSSLEVKNIDISQLTESTTIEVPTRELLPSNISLYEEADTIGVILEIEPIIERTIEITNQDLIIRQQAEGLGLTFVQDESYFITFRGIATKLETITVENLIPSISLEGLEEGEHEVAIDIYEPYGLLLEEELPKVKLLLQAIVSQEEAIEDASSEEENVVDELGNN